MSSEPAIEARDLGKAYRLYSRPADRVRQLFRGSRKPPLYEEFWALQHINLTIAKGETLGIVGRNGAGKSTLLQLICGTLTPTTGVVKTNGRVAAMLELGAGFNAEFTGRENVVTSAALLGLGPQDIIARMPDIEAFAGIGAYIDQPVKRYSSGMYARLAFAVCAHVNPDILVADEILAVGDFEFQQKCMRFMRGFRQRGTLLFVSHDAAAVTRLCDKALLLDHGRACEYGDAREICRRYHVLQSRFMSDGTGSFQTGGTHKPLPAPPDGAGAGIGFDPDMPGPARGGGRVREAGFCNIDGTPLGAVAGGEEIVLRVVIEAEHLIARPVVAFALRDRLAQILFGDDTFTVYGPSPPPVAAGRSAETLFRFRLPYMASGAYSAEIFLLDGDTLLDDRREAAILRMQSRHISPGLANLAMRDVSLTLDAEPQAAGVS